MGREGEREREKDTHVSQGSSESERQLKILSKCLPRILICRCHSSDQRMAL